MGKLLTTIPGISTLTAAAIIAEAGNPARFRDAAALPATLGSSHVCINRANESFPEKARFRSAMRASGAPSGCRCSLRSESIRG